MREFPALKTIFRANRWLAPFGLAAAAVLPAISNAENAVSIAIDTTVELGGLTFDDQEVVIDDQMGMVTLAPLGVLPGASEVTAYHRLVNGEYGLVLRPDATYHGNTMTGNATGGVSGGVNMGDNYCVGPGVISDACP